MQGSYNLWLVALSYLIAVAASYTALNLARRVSQSDDASAKMWLVAGAISMGIGIWTMHFIGMLAFNIPMSFDLDIGITLVSLLVGIAAAAFAIAVAARKTNNVSSILLSGVALGAGIAAMHYVGMMAMRMDAAVQYDLKFVAISVLVAVAASCAALWIMFTLIENRSRYLVVLKIGAGLLMGVAICGMHYSGMAAARFMPTGAVIEASSDANHTWLASTTAGMALVILGFAHLTMFFDRRLQMQQQQRDKVEQEKVRLSELLDESSNELYFFDSESHRFVRANRGACDNLGYSEDELRSMTPLDLKPEYDVASFNALLRPLRDGKQNELLFETRHRRKDGSEYPVQIHLQLSHITEPPIFVGITTDITQRKDLESQLMQAQKMQSIGQLAAGIAHEINTPAQFVGDNTRFVQDAFKDLLDLNNKFKTLYTAAMNNEITPELLDQVASSMAAADLEFLTDEVPTAIDQSLDGISRISNIVRAMKEFSHPGGKDFEAMDLNGAVRNTITVASNEWKYVADIETELADTMPPVMCFQQEINQVILNLIVNAAHAIESSREENSEEKGVIRISTCSTETDVVVAIADNGCGIPDDIRERIFEPFFTTKEVGKGSGQGLAMAYTTIVDKHQGMLLVDSTPGEGTTFTIRLPLSRPDSITDEEAA